jgi:hypothetical protein
MIGNKQAAGSWGYCICRSTISLVTSPKLISAHLGVCVTKLDGDISLQLVLESNGLNTRDGSNSGRLSVCDVSDRSYTSVCTREEWCSQLTDVDLYVSVLYPFAANTQGTYRGLLRDDLV